MALAALSVTIKHYNDQPYGLHDICVRNRTMAGGKIYVDVFLAKDAHPEPPPARTCVENGYVIRLDYNQPDRKTVDQVVLLSVYGDPKAPKFNAVVEEASWPKKPPGVVGLSPCGSAFGTLRRSTNGWSATITPQAPPAF